jgi:ribosomal-protein-alanine N-acetyltransferase
MDLPDPMQTERLLIRPIEPSDHQQVFEGLSHPEVIPYYGVSFDSFAATQEQMDWYANLVQNETGIWWAVCDKSDGTFLGAGGYNDWDHNHRKAEVGFWLHPESWGQGFMAEAIQLLFRFGFETMGLHRIEGFVFSENTKCHAAVKKVGFIHEGTMRDCEIKNGEFVSVDVYAKFR